MSHFFVDPDISRAKTLSTDFYTEKAHFDTARKRIFEVSWQFIGNRQLLSNHDCYPFTILPGYLDEPLLLTKGANDTLHCLSNVCTHRGNLLINEACSAAHIRCRYHGRLFQMNGKMTSMPEFREVRDFPSPADDLPSLNLFSWQDFLFTSLRETIPARTFLSDMMNRMSWVPLDKFRFRPELSKEYRIHANWALYCENYLEGFHIPFVHAGLNAVIDYGSYQTELFRYSSLQVGMAKKGEDCFDLPPESPDHGKKIAAYYFWVFPNMMFNFYPWGLSVNIVEPLAVDETRVSFLTYVWKEELLNRGAGNDLDKVEMEDEEVVQNVQKGIRSRFYQHGRYSVTREQGTHHFHRLIAEFMG